MEDPRWYRLRIPFTLIILMCALTAVGNAQGLRTPPHPVATAGTSLPPADIPVLENARGDIAHDSVVNVIDLLRLRDILAGRGPAPTSYEQSEADLTMDGNVTQADLDLLRNILLRKAGVPYVIDSTGGMVRGDGITLSIPPGAVDSLTLFSITRYSEPEFATEFGVDTKSAEQDSAYFMASFQITSSNIDFKLPVDATIKLDSVPPCAYQGLNGLFAAVPDRDGDGRAELFLINSLDVYGDSLTITTHNVPLPLIQTIVPPQAEPGKSITVRGSSFGNDAQNLRVNFISVAHADSFQITVPSSGDDTSLVVAIPGLTLGEYRIVVSNVVTGVMSNAGQFEVLPWSPVVGDIRSIIVGFFVRQAAGMDSLDADSLFASIEDTSVRSYVIDLRRQSRSHIDTLITYFTYVHDSMVVHFASFASYIQNMTGDGGVQKSWPANVDGGSEYCLQCYQWYQDINIAERQRITLALLFNALMRVCWDAMPNGKCDGCALAVKAVKEFVEIIDYIKDSYAQLRKCICANCAQGCSECQNTAFVGLKPGGKAVSGGYGPGGFKTDGVCINIVKYKRNQCASIIPQTPEYGWPLPHVLDLMSSCTEVPGRMSGFSFSPGDSPTARAHAGSIVKITNAPVPYDIVGVLNDNGQAFIPHVPLSTRVTFSLYDPVTGFFDPDVGTYTTGSTPGGFDHPLLVFNPNTTVRTIPIHIGDVVQDSISPSTYERTDYVLTVNASDTASLLNMGFRSSVPMALKIEDPNGVLVVDSMNTTCYPGIGMKFDKIGPYRIRISFGTGIQPGSYTFGIHYYPDAPIDKFYMCGRFVFDTLFQRLSPYIISDPVYIPLADTIVVEAGVTISFDHNGSILSYGTLFGTGSHDSPIRLQPFSGLRQKSIVNQEYPAKGALRDGKEVQP